MRTRILTASALALALVAGACGGDDDSADTTVAPATTTAATTATTAAPETTPATTGAPATTEASDDAADGPVGTGTMSAEMAAAVDDAASQVMEAFAVNGGTAFYVAIDDPDQGTYTAAYGDADTDGTPATTDDNFRIGSISKTFTAAVILQLIDEGELTLDDTVADVAEGIAVDFPDLADLTIEQLLGMTSGIFDYLNVPDSVVADIVDDPTRVWEPYELIEAGIGAGVDTPGTPGYSTTNYIVLQLIAEQLTGESLQDLIAERLVDEDDLGNIFLPPNDDTDLPEPLTRGYVAGGCVAELSQDGAEVDEGTDVTEWNASYGQGGGGMTSDIASLLNWAKSMSGSDTLSDELAATRIETTTYLPQGIDYALGIFRLGTNWWGHEGEAIGWESLELHDPETGVSIAVATNGCGGQFGPMAGFVDLVYPEGKITETMTDEQEAASTSTTTTVPKATTTTAPKATTTTVASGGGQTAGGTAVMTVGDTTVEADIVQCSVSEPDVSFRAEGETAQIVAASSGGQVSVTVSGAYEFEGTGTADFAADGAVTVQITGSGAQPDDSASVQDFTIELSNLSC